MVKEGEDIQFIKGLDIAGMTTRRRLEMEMKLTLLIAGEDKVMVLEMLRTLVAILAQGGTVVRRLAASAGSLAGTGPSACTGTPKLEMRLHLSVHHQTHC
jgi:hypothetical protein